jgi:hypothetical protein
MRSPGDYRATVTKADPPPSGRAAEDVVDPRDVSYQPNAAELAFLEAIASLNVDRVAKAEAECVIRRSLTTFRISSVQDRTVLVAAAKKLGVTISV